MPVLKLTPDGEGQVFTRSVSYAGIATPPPAATPTKDSPSEGQKGITATEAKKSIRRRRELRLNLDVAKAYKPSFLRSSKSNLDLPSMTNGSLMGSPVAIEVTGSKSDAEEQDWSYKSKPRISRNSTPSPPGENLDAYTDPKRKVSNKVKSKEKPQKVSVLVIYVRKPKERLCVLVRNSWVRMSCFDQSSLISDAMHVVFI
jgi:hypothetical protein